MKAKASEKAGEAWDKTQEAALKAKDEAEQGVLSKANEAAGRLFGSAKDAAEENQGRVRRYFPLLLFASLIILSSFSSPFSLSFLVVSY